MGLVFGIDPIRLASCEDPVEMLVLGLSVERAAMIARDHRQDLANKIARAVLGDG